MNQDEAYEDFNWRSCAYDVGCSLEDPPRGETGARTEKQDIEVDPALNDIVLDTPPDMLEVGVFSKSSESFIVMSADAKSCDLLTGHQGFSSLIGALDCAVPGCDLSGGKRLAG